MAVAAIAATPMNTKYTKAMVMEQNFGCFSPTPFPCLHHGPIWDIFLPLLFPPLTA